MIDSGMVALGATVVALEGIDGAGKSTCGPLIASTLQRNLRGSAIIENTGEFESQLGLVLKNALGSLTPIEKVYWFAADRASTLAELIAPVTSLPRVVIWDRYTASAFAYRFADRLSADPETTYRLVASVNLMFPPPDIVLLFQLDPHVAIARRGSGSEGFLHAVFEGYEFWVRKNPAVMVERIDASVSVDEVVAASVNAIVTRLRNKGVI